MVRRAQEGDAEAIAELDAELFPNICWNENSIRREIRLGWALVATNSKDRVIGFLLVRMTGAMADVIRVGVSKKHQGKGHGRAMLREAIDKLSGPMMLTVKKDNLAAKKLYMSEGFKPNSSAGEDALILVREEA